MFKFPRVVGTVGYIYINYNIYIYICHRVSLVFVGLVEKHHGLICYFVLDVVGLAVWAEFVV